MISDGRGEDACKDATKRTQPRRKNHDRMADLHKGDDQSPTEKGLNHLRAR
jgi:hypothetical protein